MGKGKGKKKLEKAIRKARKEQKKQARAKRQSSPGVTSLGLIDLQKMWEQVGNYKVEKVGPTLFQHTWDFTRQGPTWSDTSLYWAMRKEELEQQEGLHE